MFVQLYTFTIYFRLNFRLNLVNKLVISLLSLILKHLYITIIHKYLYSIRLVLLYLLLKNVLGAKLALIVLLVLMERIYFIRIIEFSLFLFPLLNFSSWPLYKALFILLCTYVYIVPNISIHLSRILPRQNGALFHSDNPYTAAARYCNGLISRADRVSLLIINYVGSVFSELRSSAIR